MLTDVFANKHRLQYLYNRQEIRRRQEARLTQVDMKRDTVDWARRMQRDKQGRRLCGWDLGVLTP